MSTYETTQAAATASYRQLLDEFADPRTFPAYWDLSDLPSRRETSGSGPAAPAEAAERAPIQDEGGASEAESWLAATWPGYPFAELRTFPAYWDLSG
jgi:hypothetical protein